MYSGQLASTGTQGWGCARAMTSSQSRSRPGVKAATSTFRRWKMMQCSGLEADAAIASLTMSLYLDQTRKLRSQLSVSIDHLLFKRLASSIINWHVIRRADFSDIHINSK